MFMHNYAWSVGFTTKELSVVRKALAGEELNEDETALAEELARKIGGVYYHKRKSPPQFQGQGSNFNEEPYEGGDDDENIEEEPHRHTPAVRPAGAAGERVRS